MKKNKKNFGRGFPKQEIDRSFKFNVVNTPKNPSVEIDPVDEFQIEYLGDPSDPHCPIRVNSDVSMLLHAKETVNKIGTEGYRFLAESRRTKTSAVQSAFDNMSDDLILSTIKSKYYQSPSELLAYSEMLTRMAADCEARYKELLDQVSPTSDPEKPEKSSDPSPDQRDGASSDS